MTCKLGLPGAGGWIAGLPALPQQGSHLPNENKPRCLCEFGHGVFIPPFVILRYYGEKGTSPYDRESKSLYVETQSFKLISLSVISDSYLKKV